MDPTFLSVNETWTAVSEWDLVGLYAKESIFDTDKWISNRDDKRRVSIVGGQRFKGHKESWVVFTMQVKRKWRGIVLRMVLWMAMLGFISLFFFFVPMEDTKFRREFGQISVLAIIGKTFTTNQALPAVDYLTLIEKYNLFIFSMNLLFMFMSDIVGFREFNINDDDVLEVLDYGMTGLGVAVFIVGHIAFAVVGSIKNKTEWAKKGQGGIDGKDGKTEEGGCPVGKNNI